MLGRPRSTTRYAAVVTLPNPYRGYAQPTWDTVTLKQLIDLLGGAGAAPPDNRYAPSGKAYFLDVATGDGGYAVQSVSNNTWTKLNCGSFVGTDTTGSWNSSTHIYTVPTTGMYLCRGYARVTDGFGTNCNVGLGIHTTESDGSFFQWNKFISGGGSRCTYDYMRITTFNAGNQLRFYQYQDSGVTMTMTMLGLAIWRIG